MEHREYIRICDGATTAVLFIHGILGTPDHFREFIPLVPATVSVCNLLLVGHGKGAAAFSRTSMKKWEQQVSEAVEQLSASHSNICIVAHSMGTLLAIEQALKHTQISNLFLLAVPLRLSLKPAMFLNSMKVYFNRIRPGDEKALAAKACCGVENDPNLLHYIGWIPRFLELFAKIRQTRRIIPLLQSPCVAYQSRNDEMVSRKSIRFLAQNPRITVNELKGSGHYYYDPADRDYLLAEFRRLFSEESQFYPVQKR